MATAIVRLNNNPIEASLWLKRDVNKTNSVGVAEGLHCFQSINTKVITEVHYK